MFEGIAGLDLTNNFYKSIVNGNSLSLGFNQYKLDQVDPLDPGREYAFNSHGFRGPEFIKNAELVTAGCSITYGLGLPEYGTWADMFGSSLGLTHNNIAKSGASVGFVVEKLFNYFNEFGHPKYLVCFFPDAKRFVVPVDGKVLTRDEEKDTANYGEIGSHGEEGQYLYNQIGKSNSEILSVKFLKRPYNFRDIYTPEFGYYTSIRYLRMLEQYCKTAGINFLWSTWDFEFSLHLSTINSLPDLKFNNYFDINTFFYRKLENDAYKDVIFDLDISSDLEINKYIGCLNQHRTTSCSCYSVCHTDLIEKYTDKNFYLGTDLNHGGWRAHPGCHLHVHYAERFLEVFKDRFNVGAIKSKNLD
jgi:hypothetical protein